MAVNVPASLKSSGIIPYATKAHQIEKIKPAVAYWCNYWIVQQIVTKGLHNSDEASKAYTASLMDQLEAAKTEHANEDAIVDDVAAKAYIEQFGLEVFDRADNAIRNNKASKQTAETFHAAYLFLDLLNIWPPLEPEIATKIKYAKFHALRITKAIKNGEDPNLSNPRSDAGPASEGAALDPMDPEVKALGGLGSPHPEILSPAREVSDNSGNLPSLMPRASSLDGPSSTASFAAAGNDPGASVTQPTMPDINAERYYQQGNGGDVSPLAPSVHGRANSEGGGYFPTPAHPSPGYNAQSGALGSPSAPQPISPIQPSPTNAHPQIPPYYPSQPPNHTPAYLPPDQMSPPASMHFQQTHSAPYTQPQLQPQPQPQPQPQQPAWPPPMSSPPSRAQQPSASQQPLPIVQENNFVADEEAVAKAQKHARWAISALNFEDVKTAVKELQNALETLGAR